LHCLGEALVQRLQLELGGQICTFGDGERADDASQEGDSDRVIERDVILDPERLDILQTGCTQQRRQPHADGGIGAPTTEGRDVILDGRFGERQRRLAPAGDGVEVDREQPPPGSSACA